MTTHVTRSGPSASTAISATSDRRDRVAAAQALLVHRVAVPCVLQPPRDDRAGVDGADGERLLELRGACDHLAVLVESDRMTVEDQLVLAADEVAEHDGCD